VVLRPGIALLRVGQPAAAERFFRECLAQSPNAQVWYYLGASQHALGKLDEATASFQKAIEVADNPDARCARATVLASLGRHAEAETDLHRALELAPTHAQALCNLAIALERRGAQAEALKLYDRVLEADPSHYAARLNRGALHLALDDAEAALRDFEQLDSGEARNNRIQAMRAYLARAFEREWACDWRDREKLVEMLRTALREDRAFEDPGFLLRALALPLAPAELRAMADATAAAVRTRIGGVSLSASPARTQGRIRVGFLSPEFRTHTGGFVLRRMFADRDRSRFEFFAYALNPADGSYIRGELEGLADQFLDVSSWSPHDIAQRMRNDGVDLILDRTGYFGGMKPEVLALRPAPVLASFMGTPCTLGQGLVDYRISDSWTTPAETQRDWPEKLVLISPPYPIFDASLHSSKPVSRRELGLPDHALVLCHLDQPHKISPEAFSIWMSLLSKAPSAVLCLLDGGNQMMANLRSEALRHGIATERLVFIPSDPYEAHLAAVGHANLFLDGLIYSSRSMAFNALNAGVPVLAHAGQTMASRLSSGFLHALGMDELIATSPTDYEKKAMELVTDKDSLRRARAKLAEKRVGSPVFDTVGRVKAVERAFIAMVERHRAGLPPDTLIID
jgi:protein O-GlcNAc transferase